MARAIAALDMDIRAVGPHRAEDALEHQVADLDAGRGRALVAVVGLRDDDAGFRYCGCCQSASASALRLFFGGWMDMVVWKGETYSRRGGYCYK